MQLTNKNIMIDKTGKKFIRYVQSKTGKKIDLPIHYHVKEILERLGGFPRPISDQKYNKYIKLVCKEVGMTYQVTGSKQDSKTHKREVGSFPKYQLVKSHIGRRSFATNHYNKLPNKVIMAVTGHSTEKQLLTYIGEVENEHIDRFTDLWEDEGSIGNKIYSIN